jgi:hypothetical protein
MATARKTNSKPAPRAKTMMRNHTTHKNGQPRTMESKPASNGAAISQETIARAAYFLWLERGGDDVTNWLEAEATLTAKSR